MIKINVITNNIKWKIFIKNPNDYIDRKINKINSQIEKFKKKKIYCTLLLSDNKEIKTLNKRFRNKNKTTDVLSFPFYKKKDLKKRLKIENEIYLGDIIINLNEIKKKKVLKNFNEEFDFLWIHGLVHLMGYDHKKEKDYRAMNNIEKKFKLYLNG